MSRAKKLLDSVVEGNWAFPKTPEDVKKLEQAIEKVEELKKSLYHVYGDDSLFDHFDSAIKMMKDALEKIPPGDAGDAK